MITLNINNKKIYVGQENPYSNEWTAVDENYDAETDEYGTWHSSCPIGVGNTADEAVNDLLAQLDDQ